MSLFAKKHIIRIKSIRYYLSTLQGVKKQKVGNPFRNGYDTIRVMRGFFGKGTVVLSVGRIGIH